MSARKQKHDRKVKRKAYLGALEIFGRSRYERTFRRNRVELWIWRATVLAAIAVMVLRELAR